MTEEIKKLVRNFKKDELAEQIIKLEKTAAEMEDIFNKTEEETIALRSRLKEIQDSKLIILTDGNSSGTQVIWEGKPLSDLSTVKLFISQKAVNASIQKIIPLGDGKIDRPIVNLIGEGYKPSKKQHKSVIKEPLTKTVLPAVKETQRKKSQTKKINKFKPEPATKKEVPQRPKQSDAWTCFECGAVNDKSKKKKGKVQCYSCKAWTKEDEL
ncbi:hypothetical protein [Terribacillus saccharophilus]|uniref:hypothetical protein n=1 Tax=Terribacillus saccharophilus TaxID=361277 RepID=UPI002DC6CD16|nr:hypothetical protein [Terribacillus saccharophilus]MEC0288942.1 hypothetical protein [Terribacillus saccharophilus]